jgi:hypothetical protein
VTERGEVPVTHQEQDQIRPGSEESKKADGRNSKGSPGQRLKLFSVVLGVIALVVGGVAVFFLRSDASAVAVVAAGVALLIIALLAERLAELSVGTKGVTLKLSQEASAAGAPSAATELEKSGLADFAAAYAVVNSELRGDYNKARIHLQDAIVERARGVGISKKIPREEVRALFVNGSPVLRILSVGLMKGDPSGADIDLVVRSITEPLTANEQYHGLDLAKRLWTRWTKTEREYLLHRISKTYFEAGSDRERLAKSVLKLPTEPLLVVEKEM